jgi:catechol 2,3-dioxygenase-like lactoylglutathione lyase family enzyme
MEADMSLNFTHTRLLVTDVKAAVAFYRDVLGFAVHADNEVYVELESGENRLALYSMALMHEVMGTHEMPSGDRVVLNFAVPNVDEKVRELEAKGVQIIVAPTDRRMWGMRTAHFRDVDGNLLEIYHDISMAE